MGFGGGADMLTGILLILAQIVFAATGLWPGWVVPNVPPPPPASCHDFVDDLGPEWSPEALGYNVQCHPGWVVPYPWGNPAFVRGYYDANTLTIHIADESSNAWVAAHEVAHHVLGPPWSEHDASCLANEILGWAPLPDC